jgi:hypothetical protein
MNSDFKTASFMAAPAETPLERARAKKVAYPNVFTVLD